MKRCYVRFLCHLCNRISSEVRTRDFKSQEISVHLTGRHFMILTLQMRKNKMQKKTKRGGIDGARRGADDAYSTVVAY